MKNSSLAGGARLLILFGAPALVGALLLAVQLPAADPFMLALQNSGHAAVFALLTVSVLPLLSAPRPPLSAPRAPLFVILCLLLGLAVEFVQSHIGRQASCKDLWLNMAGVGIGLCVLAAVPRRHDPRLRAAATIAGLALLAASFAQPALWWQRQLERDRLFPTIAAFESPVIRHFARAGGGGELALVPAPAAWQQNRSRVARLTLARRSSWPGMSIRPVYPDWRGYRALYFEIFSPAAAPLNLSLRIHDSRHNNEYDDRFNRQLQVSPGINRYTIDLQQIRTGPRYRSMDMDSIQTLIWFAHRPPEAQTVFLDNIKLL